MRASAAALAVALIAAAQQSDPREKQTFRTGIDLVQVDVSVLDGRRRPVTGLTADDFTLFEDGRATPIVAFSQVRVPKRPAFPASAAPWLREVAPDIIANDLPREGRMVVIMFDLMLPRRHVPAARKIAAAAIDALGPTDLAAVVHVAGVEPHGFTRDPARLRAAIDRPFAGLADAEAGLALIGQESRDDQRGECPEGICTLEAITRVAGALRDVPRRKTLVLIAGLIAVERPNESAAYRSAREAMLRALDLTNLTINVVDPTGLETLARDASAPSLARPSADRTGINTNNLRRQEGLRYLPARTGGRTILNANDPDAIVAAVLDETSAYYTLGFRPQASRPDGRLHQIEVRVRREGVHVQARKAFTAGDTPRPVVSADAGAKLPAALREAIAGNWPSAELPITLTTAPFADPSGGRPIAAVAIAAERTSQVDSSAPVDVLVEAFDRNGRSVNYHHQAVDLGAALAASGSGRFELYSRLPLDPGRYELRAGIRDGANGRIGTVHTHIDVPDFSRAPLSISGILVGAFPAALTAPRQLLTDLADIQSTARRVFARSDTVAIAARIYQGGQPQQITLLSRVTDATGTNVRDESKTIAADAFSGERERWFEVRESIAVKDLPPGEYVLTLAATRGDRTVQRTVRFLIR